MLSLEYTAIAITERMVTKRGIRSENAAAPSPRTVIGKSCTSVELFVVMIFTFCSPTKAMNRPMPAGIARRIAVGTARTIFSRTPPKVRQVKRMPETSTMTSACS